MTTVLNRCALAALLMQGALCAAQGVTPRDLLDLVDLGVPAVSPDRRSVAIEARRADLERNATVIRWLIVDLEPQGKGRVVDIGDGGEPIIGTFRGQVTGVSLPQSPQWSPDSQWIAYRVQRAREIQVWRSRRDGAVQAQVTHHEADVETFCWSSDGTRLIYATSPAGAEFERQLKEEGERGFLYDARFSPYYSRAPLLDPDPVPPRTQYVHEMTTGLERLATPQEARECESKSTSLLQDLRADPSIGVNPPLTVVVPDRHESSRSIVCRARECTGHMKGAWLSDDGRSVHFLRWANAREYGPLALYRWKVGSPRVTELWRGGELIDACERAHSRLICVHESATTPRTLIAVDLSTEKRRKLPFIELYDPNPEFRTLTVGEATPLTWRDVHGVEGFAHFVKPVGYQRGRRYPLIIVQYRSRGFLRGGVGDEYPIHVFSANGFAVLSFERPEDPDLEAIVKDYYELEAKNGEDLRERRRVLSVLLAGIDHLDGLGLIDPARVGITGLSDGGETVGFALATESPRFAAAAASWIAYAPTLFYVLGPKSQPQLERWGFGFPRGSAASQWQRVSLALNAAAVVTPLLLQVSDQELLPETETVAALQAHGKPVELHVFPGEGHLKVQPRHRFNIYRRSLQWFQFWLQNLEAADPVDERQYDRWRALSQTSAARQANSENN